MILDDLSASVAETVLSGNADIGVTLRPLPTDKLAYRALVGDEFGLV